MLESRGFIQVSGEENLEGPSRFHHNCNPLQSEVRDPVMQMWMQLHTLSSCRENKQFSERRVDAGDRMHRHPSALYRAPPEINILSRPTPTLPFISKSALHIFLGRSSSAPTGTKFFSPYLHLNLSPVPPFHLHWYDPPKASSVAATGWVRDDPKV